MVEKGKALLQELLVKVEELYMLEAEVAVDVMAMKVELQEVLVVEDMVEVEVE